MQSTEARGSPVVLNQMYKGTLNTTHVKYQNSEVQKISTGSIQNGYPGVLYIKINV